MPVYHYTFHAYGSWMPDRPEGYDLHGQGHKAPNIEAAKQYRQRMQQSTTHLLKPVLQASLQTLVHSQALQQFDLYAAAGEASHLHAIVAWRDGREPIRVRTQIKTSLTRALNKEFGKRQWFVAKAGQKQVQDEEHLYHLVHEYLPKHKGLYWNCKQ